MFIPDLLADGGMSGSVGLSSSTPGVLYFP